MPPRVVPEVPAAAGPELPPEADPTRSSAVPASAIAAPHQGPLLIVSLRARPHLTPRSSGCQARVGTRIKQARPGPRAMGSSPIIRFRSARRRCESSDLRLGPEAPPECDDPGHGRGRPNLRGRTRPPLRGLSAGEHCDGAWLDGLPRELGRGRRPGARLQLPGLLASPARRLNRPDANPKRGLRPNGDASTLPGLPPGRRRPSHSRQTPGATRRDKGATQ